MSEKKIPVKIQDIVRNSTIVATALSMLTDVGVKIPSTDANLLHRLKGAFKKYPGIKEVAEAIDLIELSVELNKCPVEDGVMHIGEIEMKDKKLENEIGAVLEPAVAPTIQSLQAKIAELTATIAASQAISADTPEMEAPKVAGKPSDNVPTVNEVIDVELKLVDALVAAGHHTEDMLMHGLICAAELRRMLVKFDPYDASEEFVLVQNHLITKAAFLKVRKLLAKVA